VRRKAVRIQHFFQRVGYIFTENTVAAGLKAFFAASAALPVDDNNMLMAEKTDFPYDIVRAGADTRPARVASAGIYPKIFRMNSFQFFI
jgi:hypothetical protein